MILADEAHSSRAIRSQAVCQAPPPGWRRYHGPLPSTQPRCGTRALRARSVQQISSTDPLAQRFDSSPNATRSCDSITQSPDAFRPGFIRYVEAKGLAGAEKGFPSLVDVKR